MILVAWLIPLLARLGDQRAKGTERLSGIGVPIEAVVGVGGAAEVLGVFEHAVAVAGLAGVFPLGVHISMADADGGQFVHADPAVEDFLPAGRGVEEPFSALARQGNGERPRVNTNLQHDVGVGLARLIHLLGQPPHEIGKRIAGLHHVRGNQLAALGAENCAERIGVPRLGGGHQRGHSRVRRGKMLLPAAGRPRGGGSWLPISGEGGIGRAGQPGQQEQDRAKTGAGFQFVEDHLFVSLFHSIDDLLPHRFREEPAEPPADPENPDGADGADGDEIEPRLSMPRALEAWASDELSGPPNAPTPDDA